MQLKPLNCYAKIANVDCVFKHEFSYLNLSIVANDFEVKNPMELIKETEKQKDDDQKDINEYMEVSDKNKKTTSPIFEYKLTDSMFQA